MADAISTKVLVDLCSVPTAPFAEQYVERFVREFVASHRGLKLESDSVGNLLISLPAPKAARGRARIVFTAHMDHPGMVADSLNEAGDLTAHFFGGVLLDYVKGTKVRFFGPGGEEISGVVVDASAEKGQRTPNRVVVRGRGLAAVKPGWPGMFDQGAGRIAKGKFFSRVCDDLGGASAALEMVRLLLKKPAKLPVAVLLTRAEEEGFVGCIAACMKPKLLRKSDYVIAIETSAEQPVALQGNGAVIRVGDRTSIFNSALTYFITKVATDLAADDAAFKYQRALMPGGTCEASVYDAFGFTAASICVPLGNYHNMDRKRERIGPEYIDVNDWTNMVRLFLGVARRAHEFTGDLSEFVDKVVARYRKLEPYLMLGRKRVKAKANDMSDWVSL